MVSLGEWNVVPSQRAEGSTNIPTRFEAKLLQEAQRRSYPEARSYTEEDCSNSSANLFQPKSGAKGEVELNHQGDVHIYTPSIKAVQRILKSKPFHYKFTKTLKGVFLTLEKDRTPAFIFNRSERHLTYRQLKK